MYEQFLILEMEKHTDHRREAELVTQSGGGGCLVWKWKMMNGQVSLFHLMILPICNTCCYGFVQDSSSKEGINSGARKNALVSPGV